MEDAMPTPQSPRRDQELDSPETPSPVTEPAEADQDVDIAGTEADEPAVGAAVETPGRPAGPDEVHPRDPRR
jgi:hypothetical protein